MRTSELIRLETAENQQLKSSTARSVAWNWLQSWKSFCISKRGKTISWDAHWKRLGPPVGYFSPSGGAC